jgi:hypothetical protein
MLLEAYQSTWKGKLPHIFPLVSLTDWATYASFDCVFVSTCSILFGRLSRSDNETR